ncbi:Glutathione-specific gamma-glutamylcyclotransferase [Sodalis praecaptivus]
MLTGCYIPIWSELTLDNGDSVTALAFVMDPCHPFFEADTRSQVIAPLIACASGPLGTDAQYLFALEQELNNYGMQDDCMVELVKQVRQLIQGRAAVN